MNLRSNSMIRPQVKHRCLPKLTQNKIILFFLMNHTYYTYFFLVVYQTNTVSSKASLVNFLFFCMNTEKCDLKKGAFAHPPVFMQQVPCRYMVCAIAQHTAVPCSGCKFDKHVTFLQTQFVVNLPV